jgi:chromate transporter
VQNRGVVDPHPVDPTSSLLQIFLIYLRLGCTSFGGPIAHLGYFRDEFVVRRRWLDERAYADLVGLCQFLPGPTSSQVGFALGLSRRGALGALAAWLGFTLPSAVALAAFGIGVARFSTALSAGWLHGLKLVAVAVVAQALWGMGRSLCPDRTRASVAVVAALTMTVLMTAWGQIVVLTLGGLFGCLFLGDDAPLPHSPALAAVSRGWGVFALALYVGLLVILPLIPASPKDPITLFRGFYRAGAFVIGGGHVVLPLLQSVVVPTGLMSNDLFLAGYGAAQAVPGPLFTIASFLGATASTSLSGWGGAAVGVVAIFLPGFLAIVGVLPFWETLRRSLKMQAAMRGINAAVVGILLAAFYDPVWTSAVHRPLDFAFAAVAFLLLVFWKLPPWVVVGIVAAAGAAVA